MASGKSICIVGGGIIGLCSAWYALQRGHRVTIVERGTSDGDGCSFGNAGMIVPSHFIPLAAPGMVAMGLRMMRNPRSPFYIRPRLDGELVRWGLDFVRSANKAHVDRSAPLLRDMSLASRIEYKTFSEKFGNVFDLTERGLLMLCKTHHALEEETVVAALADKLGIPATVLTPAEAAAIDPGLKMEIEGAVHYPLDAHLSPQRFVRALTDALRVAGCDFRWQTEVTSWKTQGGRIAAAVTKEGEIEADEFVIASGSWSPGLARSLGIRLPIQAGKGYSVTLTNPRQKPELCSILVEARVAVTPMGETLRFGGTMEIAGLDETINTPRVEGILEAIPRYFPEFGPADFQNLPVWHGLRPCSPDGLPYIGRFKRWSNLTAATGHAMMGVSLAPITGKLIAEVLSGEKPEIPLELLSPERFG
jgi:D-amino-acid dehydrogenase